MDKPLVVDRAKLAARLAIAKNRLPKSVAEELEKPTELQNKGVIMAALYMLGASYGQLAHLFHVRKATAAQAVRDYIGPTLRQARPHLKNSAILDWKKLLIYYESAIHLPPVKDAMKIVREISQLDLAALSEDAGE